MEKVIIDINLLMEWSVASSQENYKSVLALLKENGLQPYIFDFQSKHFDLSILKSKLKGIRIKIIEKENFAYASEVKGLYEKQFTVNLNQMEEVSLLSYLSCGFTGIKYFLRKKKDSDIEMSEVSSKFHTFNLELVKI